MEPMDDPVTELRDQVLRASHVREACFLLLDFTVHHLDIGRAVVFMVHDDRFESVAAHGIPEAASEKLVRNLRSRRERDPDDGRGLSGPTILQAADVGELAEMTDSLFVPLPDTRTEAWGGVVVDMDHIHTTSRLVAIVRDLGPALEMLAELEASREKVRRLETRQGWFRLILDTLPDPTLVTDKDQRILYSNRRAEDLLTADADASPGRRHAVERNNLFFSAHRAKVALAEEEARELILVDPMDGSDLLFEVEMFPLPESVSTEEGFVYLLRDITGLKRATAELRDQVKRTVAAEHAARRESEHLNVIIENAGVPVLVTDARSDIILMNREAERLVDPGEEAMAAEVTLQEVRTNGMKLTGHISDFLLQKRRRRENEIRLVQPIEGRTFPARLVSTKIVNPRGEPTAVVCVIHDLTEEVENERLAQELTLLNEELEERIEDATSELAERNRELEAHRHELEKASRMKSQFLATMSHELRTPLNAIIGYADLLREGVLGELEEDQRDALNRQQRQSEHLLSLINDILDLSKVEAGRVELHSELVHPDAILEEVSESVRPLIETKPISYGCEVASDVPAIRTDPQRLHQVLLNLVSNAVKFTKEGSITLHALPGRDGYAAAFEVIDTGIGIREGDLEAIFSVFRQVDQSVTREHKGTGLGLTISQRLVELLGGRISVESQFGEGSRFRVDLPKETPTPKDAVPLRPVGSGSGSKVS